MYYLKLLSRKYNNLGHLYLYATGQLRFQIDHIPKQLCVLSKQFCGVQEIDQITKLAMRNTDKEGSTILSHEYIDKKLNESLQFMHSANEDSVCNIARLLVKYRLYKPEMLDYLITFAITHGHQTRVLSKFRHVLYACSVLGYQGRNVDALLRMMLPLCDNFHKKQYLHGLLEVLNSFCELQFFPEKKLSQIFALSFIEKLNSFIVVRPEFEYVMMKVNRSVVLECPQLNIPWFHENYCKDRYIRDKIPLSTYSMNSEVGKILSELLGSSYFRKSVQSAYYHDIDFLCILDEKKNPIRCTSTPDLPPNYQKVAMLLMPENRYCYNSKQLLGRHQQKQRHLEIMNYKVVLIPHYEWYSESLAIIPTKADYLANKLYS